MLLGCRDSPTQFWPFTLFVESPNDDLTLGSLAYMLGGLLHRVREQRKTRCPLDGFN